MFEGIGQGVTLGGGGVPTVRTLFQSGNEGNSASLPLAVHNSIDELKVYGFCSQNGTPTPVNPVPVVCNNGALVVVDDELPIGYKRITDIKFDGYFWYETGEALTGDDDVTMTLANTVSSGKNVFGSYNGTASGTKNFSLYLYGGGSSSNCYFRYGSQLVRPRFGDGERTITFGASGTSGFATNVSVTPEDFTAEAPAYIGMLPNSSSASYTGSIMGSITVGTRLKWIPCERESDGVVGYYEAVNGVFLEPTGTGTPVAGSYDTSHLNRLVVVGTPEVLSVTASGATTQTASVINLFSIGAVHDEQDIISGLLTKRVSIKVLDGTETWTTDTFGGYRRMVLQEVLNASSDTLPVLCSHYVSRAADARQQPNSIFIASSGKLVIYVDSTQNISTVQEFNAWLAVTPVIVVYPLAEEATEQTTPQAVNNPGGNITVSVNKTNTFNRNLFDGYYKKAVL